VFITTGANSLNPGPSVVAYDAATGAVRWTASLGGASAEDVLVSPGGSAVFILGSGPLLAAYDARTGAVRWMDALNPSLITPQSMAVSPDGSKVVVTGLRFGGTGNFLRAVAYDSATGTTIWSRQVQGAHGSSFGCTAAFSPDSATVYIAGATRMAGNNNLYSAGVWAYNAVTGASAWQRTLPAVGPGTGNCVLAAVSPDGTRVFVTSLGSASSPAGAFSTAALDAATGARLWVLSHQLAGNHWRSFPGSIEVSPDGTRVFVSGGIDSPTPTQVGSMVTVAYNS
jgi:DNA-binding beta-propeller fold protein YncE